MTTFYIQDENMIVLSDTDKQKLLNTIAFMPQYKNFPILETENLIIDGVMMTEAEYEEKKAQEECERISMLFLTAADVERGLYKALGKDFEDIIEIASSYIDIDIKALKIELKANNFYRGNPYVSQMGALLSLTEKQLDEFFETGDYKKLLTEKD